LNRTRTILVIGGGPAGTFAAIAARKQDPAADVVLLTDEHCEPYEKPPLSKAVLLGKVLPSDAPIAGPTGMAGHRVTLECRAACHRIDRSARVAILEDGRRLAYDALVIATGAVARQIPLLPPDLPGVHYLRSEADAHRLKTALVKERRLLVVGGGLIGLEVAASAATIGVETVVVEVAPRILSRVADDETAATVHAEHERHGVRILVATSLLAVDTQPDGEIAVALSTGQTLGADVVVVGTGAKPNDALAAEAGLATDDGIIVDDRCRTSDPAIFAAGDVVRFPGPHGSVRLENWKHAQDQGAVAGRNAAGGDERYVTVPSFWSEQYDLYIQGVGWPVAGATRVRRPGTPALLFDVKDGRLVYAMGINAQRDLAAARRIIERQVPVEEAALADPSRPLAGMLKR